MTVGDDYSHDHDRFAESYELLGANELTRKSNPSEKSEKRGEASKMDRVKRLFQPDRPPTYTHLNTDRDADQDTEEIETDIERYRDEEDPSQPQSQPQTLPRRPSQDGNSEEESVPFSIVEYNIFLLLGVAMLWAWNMFMAAAPYFQTRFHTSAWILDHFQASELSVSTITNLSAMIVLSTLQKGASYPKRISAALLINIVTFAALALSTTTTTKTISAAVYFAFLMVVVFAASLGTALIQNGLFSFASGFGRREYTQAIMTGQAVAGVLPPLAQIVLVLVVKKGGGDDDSDDDSGSDGVSNAAVSSTSALIYFLTATGVSVIALLAFWYLLRRKANIEALGSARKATMHETAEGDVATHIGSASVSASGPPSEAYTDAEPDGTTTSTPTNGKATAAEEEQDNGSKTVPLTTLLRSLPFLAAAVFICFAVTMVFPVFTASISPVNADVFDAAVFVPLAFLVWNVGDLIGRLMTIFPAVLLTHWPFALFSIAMARLLFIPLYFLCNIKDKGAVVPSDSFYLIVVQLGFGLTNGYLGSQCMMGAGDWVRPEEREAAGGFMGLMLVAGLTVGSLLSFAVGDA